MCSTTVILQSLLTDKTSSDDYTISGKNIAYDIGDFVQKALNSLQNAT